MRIYVSATYELVLHSADKENSLFRESPQRLVAFAVWPCLGIDSTAQNVEIRVKNNLAELNLNVRISNFEILSCLICNERTQPRES